MKQEFMKYHRMRKREIIVFISCGLLFGVALVGFILTSVVR